MDLLGLMQRRASVLQGDHVANNEGWWRSVFADDGKLPEISPRTSLTLAAVWCAVWIISMDVARLPVHVMQRNGTRRQRVTNSPLARLMARPSDVHTARVFRATLTNHVLQFGNGYAEIVRGGDGTATGMYLLDPQRMKVLVTQGRIVYEYQQRGGAVVRLAASEVLHVRGLSYDGIVGLPVIDFARRSLGGVKATEEYGVGLYTKRAVPSGLLTTENTLTRETRERLREQWDATYGGPNPPGGVAVLDAAMKFTALAMTPEQTQWIERAAFDVRTVAKWYGLPPSKLGAEGKSSTYSNIEQDQQLHVDQAIVPRAEGIREELEAKLLTDEDRDQGIYLTTVYRELLRGSNDTRFASYERALNSGWMSVDDVRQAEDMDPVAAGGGFYRWPVNAVPTERVAEAMKAGTPVASGLNEPEATPAPAAPASDQTDARSVLLPLLPVIEDCVEGLRRIERDKAMRALRRGELAQWHEQLAEEHTTHVAARCFAWVQTARELAGSKVEVGLLVRDVAAHHVRTLVSDVRLDGPEPLTQLSDAELEARATALLEVVVAGLRPGRA